METSILKENIRALIEKFEKDRHYYLSKDYLEAQTRQDFIDPFFEALGWDISNKAGLAPFEREVLVEKGQTTGRPDYNFRLGGTSKFFVEAKAPSQPLDKVSHILQAKSYAWNTKEVFIVVLTDFEEIRLFDASLPPDKKNPLQGLIFDLRYTDYLNNIEKLLPLSKEEVDKGSLERLIKGSKRQRIPVDKKFLQDMGLWREELAKDVYKHNPDVSVRTLNEVVQRLLDRIVFIRIAEDRKIIEPRTLFEIAQLWKAEGKKRPIQYHLNNLFREINADLNGDIFKSPHACEQCEIDSSLLAGIIEDLYFPNSPYLFDVIGVELLGSIYERYLGSTIRVTPAGRVKVEEKPEVRKAGGVYYTPQYIVKYIVENTVGKLIEGKTPKQIEKIKILDPACGSGSFLLGAFRYLIDYHIKYYREHPRAAHTHPLFPDLLRDSEGNYRLSIIKKGHILRNNIFGVDIDPQAVEVTMMSLYLKALEGERTLPRKQGLLPVLSDNIKCGNSLIGYDIFEQGQLFPDEERERINPFDWNSKSAGFGRIMERSGFDCVIGNPPYVTEQISDVERQYLSKVYSESRVGKLNTYRLFIHKGIVLLRDKGLFGFIVPNTYLSNRDSAKLREMMLQKVVLMHILVFPESMKVFEDVTQATTILIFQREKSVSKCRSNKVRIIDPVKSREDLILQRFKVYPQGFYLKTPENMFLTSVDYSAASLLSKMEAHSETFDNFANVFQGEVNVSINKKWIATEKVNESYKPLVRGNDIDRYFVGLSLSNPKGSWVDARRIKRKHQKDTRIVTQEVSNMQQARRLNAVYIPRDVFCGHTANYILLKETPYHGHYFVALLNSRVLDFYFKQYNHTNHIPARELKRLPIHTINFDNAKEKAMHDRLVGLVDRMLELNKKKHSLPASSGREAIEREIAVTDERIDDLVYELYGIIDKEKKIIKGS